MLIIRAIIRDGHVRSRAIVVFFCVVLCLFLSFVCVCVVCAMFCASRVRASIFRGRDLRSRTSGMHSL